MSEGLVESPIRIPTEGLLMESARRLGRVVQDRGQTAAPAGGAQASASDSRPGATGSGCRSSGRSWRRWMVSATCTPWPTPLGKSEFDVARTIYTLAEAGVVVLDAGSSHNGKDPHHAAASRREKRWPRASIEQAAAGGAGGSSSDPLMPEARRLLGVCQAALGRFRGAAETWKSWSRLGTQTPAEEALSPAVERLRASGRNPGGRAGELS